MAVAIEGRIGNSFTKGALGLRFYTAEDLEKPLKHVTEARFVSDGDQINNGYVVMVPIGGNLVIQVGYKASITSFGFGIKISRDNENLVEALYFPTKGTIANKWTFGTLDVDDQGMVFLVRSNEDLKSEHGESVPYSKLTFTVWPIDEWKYEEKSYGKSKGKSTVERSATIAGIDKGDFKGQGLDMRFARIVSDDFNKRQDLAVTFLTGDVQEIKDI